MNVFKQRKSSVIISPSLFSLCNLLIPLSAYYQVSVKMCFRIIVPKNVKSSCVGFKDFYQPGQHMPPDSQGKSIGILLNINISFQKIFSSFLGWILLNFCFEILFSIECIRII
jgi:hypothetical protein